MSTTTSTGAPMTTPKIPMDLDDYDNGYSAGTTFCILFFVTCLCYFGGGILVRKVLRGAEGHEMIPHYDFWHDLPALIRDGTLFVVKGCQPELIYERI